MKPLAAAALLSICLAASAQSVPPSGDGGTGPGSLYSIDADTVDFDDATGTTVYRGNARVVVANLVIEADAISITDGGGLPSKIAAEGSPIRFRELEPKQNISGTATAVTFLVNELKLTLVDYSIVDPSGNRMQGKKASFVLSP